MKKTRVAINGLGRIGRAFLRATYNEPNIEIVAVNDLGNIDNLAYLLKYDSAYGKAPFNVEADKEKGTIKVNDHEITFVSQKDPTQLPWKVMNIDVVVESTGFFESFEKAKAHIDAGAKRVVITAPAKDEQPYGKTILVGINQDEMKVCQVTSNASCTTNSASPVIAILNETIGIQKAMLSTVHAYTAVQKIVDGPDEHDWRHGRAGAHNIIPTSTGAAKSVTKVITDLLGKFDGISMRVPVITGSVADITFLAKRKTSVEEVNKILTEAAKEARWKKVLKVSDEELVSSDIVGEPYASIVDLKMTRVVDGDLVKVLAWYDNETGYTKSLVEHVLLAGENL